MTSGMVALATVVSLSAILLARLALRGMRPNRERWKAMCNCGDGDDIVAYKNAARRLGIRIRFGYPVPAPAGADLCASLGMRGVYINRADIRRERELQDAKWEEEKKFRE